MRSLRPIPGLLAALFAVGCQTNPQTSRPMVVAGPALPPAGFVAFCAVQPEACKAVPVAAEPMPLTADRWQQLVAVNDAVNGGFRYASDRRSHGRDEHWAYLTGAGDCEDFALEKQRRLAALGWPRDTLLIALAELPQAGGHAVLVVVTDAGEYVLDVLSGALRPWDQVPYRWTRRQSRNDPKIWVTLGA